MPVTIDLQPKQTLVEIADAKGEYHDYAWLLAPLGPAAWACTLRKLGTEEPYRITLERGGWWRCSCADHKFRGPDKRGDSECKHVAAAKQLRALCQFIAAATVRLAAETVPQPEEYPCPPL